MSTILPKFYLASQSPRRQTLLNQIGAHFDMLLPDPTEDVEALETALPNEIANVYVQRVSYLKAQAAVARRNKRQLQSLPVLSADTIVAVKDRILGKPADQQNAQEMLACLSGKTHEVLTAICLFAPDDHYYSALSVSQVRFRRLSSEDIQRYIDSGEPFGKAGAYAIQGRAAEFMEHIAGSYSGIMGLPLFETAALLKQFSLL